jgi:hypothetical protein
VARLPTFLVSTRITSGANTAPKQTPNSASHPEACRFGQDLRMGTMVSLKGTIVLSKNSRFLRNAMPEPVEETRAIGSWEPG